MTTWRTRAWVIGVHRYSSAYSSRIAKKKRTLVIPKGILPLRHTFHSFLWRTGYQLNTPFIKKKTTIWRQSASRCRETSVLYIYKKIIQIIRISCVFNVGKNEIGVNSLSQCEVERSANCAARGSRHSSLFQIGDWRSGSNHGKAIPMRLVLTTTTKKKKSQYS